MSVLSRNIAKSSSPSCEYVIVKKNLSLIECKFTVMTFILNHATIFKIRLNRRTPLTQTLKGNEKSFELTRVVLNFVYWINVLIYVVSKITGSK